MSENYFAIEVKTKKEAVEAVEFALLESGAEGTELNLLGKQPDESSINIIGYFQGEPDFDTFQKLLAEALVNQDLDETDVFSVEIRPVENRNWLDEWKKHWRPTETEKFIVAPSWSNVNEANKIIIRIEPGMAFGTGTHETTKLCLQAIEKYYDGGTFFDVGTGTGILAIAAAKLIQVGHIERKYSKPLIQRTLGILLPIYDKTLITGCDIDEKSIEIAEENARLNGVFDEIHFDFSGLIDTDDLPEMDFIVANLTADVIVPILPLLVNKFKQYLVLSGILVEQQDWVVDELRKLQVKDSKFEIETLGEWISIVVKNA